MKNPQNGFSLDFVAAARTLGRYDRTREDAKLLAKIIERATHPRILDVCCGFGRFSAELHALGFDVTGIDISPEQIALARVENPGPRYEIMDMRMPPSPPYDGIINMFTSFGYFDSLTEDTRALRAWFQALRRDGILVMELADMDRARARLPCGEALILRETGDVVEHCTMDWEQRIFGVTYLQGESKFTCYTRLYEKEELKMTLLGVGFSKVQLFGSLALTKKANEDNLIVIATK